MPHCAKCGAAVADDVVFPQPAVNLAKAAAFYLGYPRRHVTFLSVRGLF